MCKKKESFQKYLRLKKLLNLNLPHVPVLSVVYALIHLEKEYFITKMFIQQKGFSIAKTANMELTSYQILILTEIPSMKTRLSNVPNVLSLPHGTQHFTDT